MSEANLWARIRKGMGTRWDASRHEDKTENGIPDVSFGIDDPRTGRRVNGWMELKYVRSIPRNITTPTKIKWQPGQKSWLRRRQMRGGNCWVLLQIGSDVYLISAVHVDKIDETPWTELPLLATAMWEGQIDYEELASCLVR